MHRVSLAAAAFAAIALLSGCTPAAPSAPFPARSVPSYSDQAIGFCQDLVEGRLKAPATAQFHATASPADAANPESGPWTITGTVDSENSFGALLRMNWVCESTLEPDTMKFHSTLTQLE